MDKGVYRKRVYSHACHFNFFSGHPTKSPEAFLNTEIRPRCFKEWEKINPEGVSQSGNRINIPIYGNERPDKSWRYFAEPRDQPRKIEIVKNKKRGVNWFGVRNGDILKANSRKLSKKEKSKIKTDIFRKKRKYTKPKNQPEQKPKVSGNFGAKLYILNLNRVFESKKKNYRRRLPHNLSH